MLQRLYILLNKKIKVTLQYNGGTQSQMHDWLDRKLWGMPCTYRPQTGNSLGKKLKLAVKDSFRRGNKNVIVIGKLFSSLMKISMKGVQGNGYIYYNSEIQELPALWHNQIL